VLTEKYMYTGQRERRKMERFCFTYLHNSELCFKSAKVTLGQSKKQQAHFWRESGSKRINVIIYFHQRIPRKRLKRGERERGLAKKEKLLA
jgi:hypothetical protein